MFTQAPGQKIDAATLAEAAMIVRTQDPSVRKAFVPLYRACVPQTGASGAYDGIINHLACLRSILTKLKEELTVPCAVISEELGPDLAQPFCDLLTCTTDLINQLCTAGADPCCGSGPAPKTFEKDLEKMDALFCTGICKLKMMGDLVMPTAYPGMLALGDDAARFLALLGEAAARLGAETRDWLREIAQDFEGIRQGVRKLDKILKALESDSCGKSVQYFREKVNGFHTLSDQLSALIQDLASRRGPALEIFGSLDKSVSKLLETVEDLRRCETEVTGLHEALRPFYPMYIRIKTALRPAAAAYFQQAPAIKPSAGARSTEAREGGPEGIVISFEEFPANAPITVQVFKDRKLIETFETGPSEVVRYPAKQEEEFDIVVLLEGRLVDSFSMRG